MAFQVKVVRKLGLADVVILCLLGGVIAAVVAFAREVEGPFHQAVQLDLRATALPRYTLYSFMRGVRVVTIRHDRRMGPLPELLDHDADGGRLLLLGWEGAAEARVD